MPQFRPFLPFGQVGAVDVMEDEECQYPKIMTEPLGSVVDNVDVVEDSEHAPVTTEPLEVIAEELSSATGTDALTDALQAMVVSKAAARVVIIPGRAGAKATTTAPLRKMSSRLRQGLVLASLLLVVVVSLLSLSPLANGQY